MQADFYNAEFKQRFLNTIKQQGQVDIYYTTIFNKSAEKEQQCGRDLCTFTSNELLAVVKFLGYMSVNKYYAIRSALLQYLTFAYKQGYTSEHPENVLSNITYASIGLGSSFYDKYYYSYKQMMSTFDTVMQDVHSLPIVRVRIMISLVFWGFPKEDLLDLTCADLSFTDRTVYSKTLRKPIVVPFDVINLCIAAANTKDYIDMTGRKIQVADTDAVIKLQTKSNIKDVTVKALIANTYKTFRNVWLEQVQLLAPDLQEWYATKTFNLNDVETSGLLYRVYLQEQACGYSYSTIGEFTKAANIKPAATAFSLFTLYKQWKQAYDL